MNNPNEEIMKLKDIINQEEEKIKEYKEKLFNLKQYNKIKKLVDISGYFLYIIIALIFGLPTSMGWFLILLCTFLLMHNAVTMVGFETKEEIEEKKNTVRSWIKESKDKIDDLERKIYFLENPIKKEELKHTNEIDIKDYKVLDKDITKKLVK